MATAALTLRRVIENRQGKPPENESPEIPVSIVPIPPAPQGRGQLYANKVA